MKLCSTIVVLLWIFDHFDNILNFFFDFINSFYIWKPLLYICCLLCVKLILVKDLTFWKAFQNKCESKWNDEQNHCFPHKLPHLSDEKFGESLSFGHILKINSIEILSIFIHMVQSILNLKLNLCLLISFLEIVIDFVLHIETNYSVVKPISVQLSKVIMGLVKTIWVHIVILLQISEQTGCVFIDFIDRRKSKCRNRQKMSATSRKLWKHG